MAKSGRKYTYPLEILRGLFLLGYSDERIGKELGIAASSVRRPRQKLGLFREVGFKKHPVDLRHLRKAFHAGATDKKIAEQQGIKWWTIKRARLRLGLKRPTRLFRVNDRDLVERIQMATDLKRQGKKVVQF